MGVLQGWPQNFTSEEYLCRYEVAHGGNILADCEAIERMFLNCASTALNWSSAFALRYSISYSLVKDEIRIAPTQVVDTFNILVNASTLHTWNKPAKSTVAKDIQNGCKEIIQEMQDWLTRGKRSIQLLSEGTKAQHLYNRVKILYNCHRYA